MSRVAGVVLHSPFMSGLRVVCPGTTRRFCFDPFTNIDKVARILSPTLIIHGTDDEIIGIHHGHELYSRLKHPLEPAWIEGAGHNDIELFAEYAIRLDRFFNEDLGEDRSTCPGAQRTIFSPACVSPVGTISPNQSFVRSTFGTKQRFSTSRKTPRKPNRNQPDNTRGADLSAASYAGITVEGLSDTTNGHPQSDGNREVSARAQSAGHGDYSRSSQEATDSHGVWTTRRNISGPQLCRTSTIQETLTCSETETNSSSCSRSSSSGTGTQRTTVREDSAIRRRSKSSIKRDSIRQHPTISSEAQSVRTTTTTAVILPSAMLDSVD
ncbi:unnamed protein product [Echinostoma caproni]|uniref:Hydrolase_4 domain-containing protein n=1 Tax=Echinostoma caproni TaxID=27848 RepID=A0A183AQC1_9TREM|nr:unnamed protein product [Echinostoma caproni]